MRLFLFLLLALAFCTVNGQNYGNEWISFSSNANDYVKFQTKDRGLYRIAALELTSAGVNLTQVNGANFQLFYRGKEVPIYVTTPGPFSTNDYIEFFADKHDGDFDTQLFKEADWQLHTYSSLFSDSSTFFLTWNNQTFNERMVKTVNDLSNPPPKDSIYRHEEILLYETYFNQGKPFQIGGSSIPFNLSDFEEGEGYTGVTINSTSMNYVLPFSSSVEDSVDFEITLVGKSNRLALNPDHHVRINLGGDTIDRYFDGYDVFKASKRMSSAFMYSPSTNCIIEAVGDLYSTDRIAVSNIKLVYERSFNFNNSKDFKFNLAGDSNSRKYIEIESFNSLSSQSILYDLTNKQRLEGQFNGVHHRFALESSVLNRELYISSEANVKSVSSLKKIEMINFYDVNNQGDYIIITHPSLQDSSNGTNWIKSYADYRNSQGLVTKVYDFESLSNQFAYGEQYHPMAYVNFFDFMSDQWFYNTKGIFLVGLGLGYNYKSADNVLPCFGAVMSDQMLAAELYDYRPRFPIGRLAATTPDDVRIYLEKVQDHESNVSLPQTIEDKAWMKEILHFGGGSDIIEQQQFESYLNQYKDLLEDTAFGGNVTTFLKNSSNPIQIAYSQLFDSLFNNGVSIMNFFGHSSANSFDFSVDVPENYTNTGKYPLVISNGCYSGNMYTSGLTMSKRFVIQEDKGSIGFLAAAGLSYSAYDHIYSYSFLEHFSQKSYGLSLGGLIKESIHDLYDTTDMFLRYTCQTFNLHGEPFLHLNTPSLPDYAIDVDKVRFNPSYVTVNEDSFEMHFEVFNLGKAVHDSFLVRVERTFPDGSIAMSYEEMHRAPLYNDTIIVSIETNPELALGINSLKVEIDPTDQAPILQIDELENYLNNVLEVELIILSDDIMPVYPFDYSIVGDTMPVLSASTVNVFAPKRRIVWQLDTTALFNSPIRKDTIIEQIGGLIKWQPNFNYTDSVVYYWRISLDSIYSGDFKWNQHSFIYLSNENGGWNQSHLYQLKENDFSNVKLEQHNKFEFIDDLKDIMLFSYNWANYPNSVNGKDVGYYINGSHQSTIACLYNFWPRGGVSFAVFDSTTVIPWVSKYNGTSIGDLGNKHCQPNALYHFDFPDSVKNNTASTQLWRERIVQFIDTIPNGNYVLAFIVPGSAGPFPQQWNEDLYLAFESLGSNLIRNVPNKTAWGMFVQKGNSNFTIIEDKADTSNSALSFNVNVNSLWTQGGWKSPKIGPAAEWKRFQWDALPKDANNESYSVKLIGVDPYGVEHLLEDNVLSKDTSLKHLLARDYPYLRLEINCRDDSLRTPLQLKYWRLLYEEIPESNLSPVGYLNFYRDTLVEGDSLVFETMVENVSKMPMDSLLIDYYILTENQGVVSIDYARQDSLRVGSQLLTSIKYDTRGLSGENRLLIKVNPDYDQLEYSLFNNVGLVPFYVKKDNTHPLLDVTFDGVHILDGDIVSAQPEIRISLQDENTFLALDDTSLLNLFIVNPEGQMNRQSFSSNLVNFYPASLNTNQGNKAEVHLMPSFTKNGIYKLIVQGKDKSNNSVAQLDYVITFEVIIESSISHIMNYPNPFSSQTKFIFTLTGVEVPDYFKIQIFNISGKVVKEIFKEDLGPIHIGRNVTEYSWDGRDSFGDMLANGVYLYRVVTRIKGQSINHRTTSIDKFFKSGLGKMVLIR